MKIHAIQTGTVAITTRWRDGVEDEAAERLTAERIRAYAAGTPTVYLPTHDPETAARLAKRQPIGAAREKAIA